MFTIVEDVAPIGICLTYQQVWRPECLDGARALSAYCRDLRRSLLKVPDNPVPVSLQLMHLMTTS